MIPWSLAVFLAAASGVTAQPPSPRDPDAWQINLVTYYWRPATEIRLRLDGRDYSAEQPFLDDAWSFKPSVLGVGFSVTRRNWGLFVEGETLDSDYDIALDDGGPGELELQSQRVSLGAAYSWHHPMDDGAEVSISPWVGGRYRHASLKLLDLGPSPDEQDLVYEDGKAVVGDGSDHWFEPVGGIQARWKVNPKWSMSLVGDVDGLLENEVSWSATSWVRFHWSREFYVSLGYRYSDFVFDRETADSGWTAEGMAKGILLGVEFDFDTSAGPRDVPRLGGASHGDVPVRPARTESNPGTAEKPELPDESSAAARMASQMERGAEYVNEKLDAGVGYVDSRFVSDQKTVLPREKARAILSLHARVTETAQNGVEFDLKPAVKAKLDMPNLARGLKLAISSGAVDEKPGIDPFDRESGLNLGIEATGLHLKRTRIQVGIRSTLSPYASIAWTPEWRHRRWLLSPMLRGYYRTDKGAGTIASLGVTYRIRDHFRASYLPAFEYGDDTDEEVEWLQNLVLLYLFEGTDQKRHRALMTKFSARGAVVDKPLRYRWTPFRYLAPLRKDWLYWEIGPEITWSQLDRWEPEASLRVGIRSVFE